MKVGVGGSATHGGCAPQSRAKSFVLQEHHPLREHQSWTARAVADGGADRRETVQVLLTRIEKLERSRIEREKPCPANGALATLPDSIAGLFWHSPWESRFTSSSFSGR